MFYVCATCQKKIPVRRKSYQKGRTCKSCATTRRNRAAALPQEYITDGDVSWIVLKTKSGEEIARTQIDTSDVLKAKELRWYYNAKLKRVSGSNSAAEPMVYLYRFLLGAPALLQVDHINGDRMDNRRANLRVVTASEQYQNVATHGSASGYRNVYYSKEWGWYAGVYKNGTRTTKYYHTKEEAIVGARLLREQIFTHAVEERHKDGG